MSDTTNTDKSLTIRRYGIALTLATLTLAIYWRVGGYDFICLDDPTYITQNRYVLSGLSLENISWAFSSLDTNWHPLTWISHQLDIQLFGLNPGPHHLVNLLLHTCNILLLFVVMSRMTGMPWHSAFIAAIFAFHPTHVESVAWLSERKDVLNTLFFMLTLLTYHLYTGKHGKKQYPLLLFFYACTLMSKSMAVTLPVLLLLFDYYPLNRFSIDKKNFWQTNRSLFLEKLPLLLMAAAVSIATIAAQYGGGAMARLENITLAERFANAVLSYCIYIYKLFLPLKLAIYYPRHVSYPAPLVAGCAIALVAVTWFAWRKRNDKPYLIVGWLFYLITLLPVIGIVQVGDQAYADRYTYIPYIGLAITLAFLADDLTRSYQFRFRRLLLSAGSVILLGFFILQTSNYLRTWQNSLTVSDNAVKVASDNYLMRNHLGLALATQGRYSEAMLQFERAITLKPDFALAYYNKGLTQLNTGDHQNAISSFSQSIMLIPIYADAYYNRALTYFAMQQYDNALQDLQTIETLGNTPRLINNVTKQELFVLIGRIYSENGDQQNALKYLNQAVMLFPGNVKALVNMSIVNSRLGNHAEAITSLEKQIVSTPQNAELHFTLGVIYGQTRKYREAIASFDQAIRLDPGYAMAFGNRGEAHHLLGNDQMAQQDFKAACEMGGTQWCGK